MFQPLPQKLISVQQLQTNPEAVLHGAARIVDNLGQIKGVFFDKGSLADFFEDWLSQDAEFIQSLDESRASGRVSSSQVRQFLNL